MSQVHRRPLALGDAASRPPPGRDRAESDRLPLHAAAAGPPRTPARSAAVGLALEHNAERVRVDAGAEAGGQLERLLGLRRQVVQLAHHQLDDVVGVALARGCARRPSASDARRDRRQIEPVPVQRGQELDGEERVAARLLAHQVGERRRLRGEQWTVSATSSPTCASGSGPSTRSWIAAPCTARFVQRAHQRMRGSDLVVAVGADDEQVPRVRVQRPGRQQLQAGRVRPLQIVEEQGQRVLRRRERAARTARSTLRNRVSASASGSSGTGGCAPMTSSTCGIRSTMSWPFGPSAAWMRRRQSATLSALSARMSSTSSRNAWHDGEVGDVALVLLELPRDEEAPLRRRSAGAARAPATTCRCPSSPRPARAPARRWRPRARTPRCKTADSAAAAVELLRDQETIGDVALAERERRDHAGLAPLLQAALEIVREAGRALVALVGHLGEQLEHDVRDHGRGSDGRSASGGGGLRATWQCTQPMASLASKGRRPVSSW